MPFYTELLQGKKKPGALREYLEQYYRGQRFIEVCSADSDVAQSGYLPGNGVSGWDGLKIYVTGNDERVVLSAQFDNLGKGASGAAIECMNLVLGCDEAKGLHL